MDFVYSEVSVTNTWLQMVVIIYSSPSFSLSIYHCLSPCLPSSRQHCVSGDDVWSLFLGWPLRQSGPQTVPAYIHVSQRLFCLPFLLCPGLQYVPLLPHGVWLRVSLFNFPLLTLLQTLWSIFPPLPLLSLLLQIQNTWQEVILTARHQLFLIPRGIEEIKQKRKVCRNQLVV